LNRGKETVHQFEVETNSPKAALDIKSVSIGIVNSSSLLTVDFSLSTVNSQQSTVNSQQSTVNIIPV